MIWELRRRRRQQPPEPCFCLALDEVVEVTVETTHSCARRSDGSVWCWGSDLYNTMGRQRASALRTFSALSVDRP